MRIGISVLTFEGQNIWSNGLGQNVFHLGRVLQSIPFVTDVVLLNCGDQATLSEAAAPGFQTLRLVKPREAAARSAVMEAMYQSAKQQQAMVKPQ